MGSWRSVWLGAVCVLCAGAMAPDPAVAGSGAAVYSGTGTQQVADAIARFEAAIGGTDNGTAPGPLTGGFRTLNWDDAGVGVYSAQSSVSPQGWVDPAGLDWLNFSVANARGLDVGTAGSDVEVSGDGFRDLNPAYPGLLTSPSGPHAFGPLDSTETDLTFEVPDSHASPGNAGGPGTAPGDLPGSKATASGIGVVFMNVEAPATSSIEYLAAGGRSLGTYFVPAGPRGAPEFVGALFDGAPVAAVRIISGTVPLSAGLGDDGGQHNVVALGDLVSSEPVGGPSVTIATPVTPGSPVTVTGTTHDPIGVPSVMVAGTPATVSADGAWTATVAHLDVAKAMEATATDSRGLTRTAVAYPSDAVRPDSGTPASPACHVALVPAVITVAGRAAKHHRAPEPSGHLTVRARCTGAFRGLVTATLTTITHSIRHHRQLTVTRTFVLRAHPIALRAGRGASQTLALPRQLAARLVDQHPQLRVRLALRAVGVTRAVAAAAIGNVRVLRLRQGRSGR